MNCKRLLIICILCFSITLSGCGLFSSGGYNAVKYLNLDTGNPQEQLITIGRFSGMRTEKWDFDEATEIRIGTKLEKGNINVALYDINNDLIFDTEVRAEEEYEEVFKGQFLAGTYTFIITSRKASDIIIRLEFVY